jgi:hypothetical protein
MRMKRIPVAGARIDVSEEVERDHCRLWLLPHHGYYPSEAIARAVARTHQCSDAGVRAVRFERVEPEPATPPEDARHAKAGGETLDFARGDGEAGDG